MGSHLQGRQPDGRDDLKESGKRGRWRGEGAGVSRVLVRQKKICKKMEDDRNWGWGDGGDRLRKAICSRDGTVNIMRDQKPLAHSLCVCVWLL